MIYQYTPATCQTVTASLCLSSYDTRLDIYTGSSCPGDVFVACSDDFCGTNSQVVFYGAAGVTYFIRVGGFGSSSGIYELQLTSMPATPPNDACAGATPILGLPYDDWGTTACAANNYANCVGVTSAEVVYRLNLASVPPCGTVTVSTCGSFYDTGLEIRSGGACPGTTLVLCDDDSPCQIGGTGLQTSLIFAPTVGVDYWIKVHGFDVNAGVYHLSVRATCQPESLVIAMAGNDILLDWAAPQGLVGGFVTYRVYRAPTPDVPIIPANFIGSAGTATYTDVGRLLNPASPSFYAVTADLTFFAAAVAQSSDNEKSISAADADALRDRPWAVYAAAAIAPTVDPAKAAAVLRNEQNPLAMNPYPQNGNAPANPK